MDNIVNFDKYKKVVSVGPNDYALILRTADDGAQFTEVILPEGTLEEAKRGISSETILFSMFADSFHHDLVAEMVFDLLEEYCELIASGEITP